jgi:hypothetical protein
VLEIKDVRVIIGHSGLIEFVPIEAARWLWRPSEFSKAIRVQVVR